MLALGRELGRGKTLHPQFLHQLRGIPMLDAHRSMAPLVFAAICAVVGGAFLTFFVKVGFN
jgi:hypothetical protein